MLLGGVRVVVCEDQPKMQLSARVCEVLSPEFAATMNDWMRGFFGITNTMRDGEALHDRVNNLFYMNPRTYAALRKATND